MADGCAGLAAGSGERNQAHPTTVGARVETARYHGGACHGSLESDRRRRLVWSARERVRVKEALVAAVHGAAARTHSCQGPWGGFSAAVPAHGRPRGRGGAVGCQ
jgi:hypothetical protein